MIPEPISSILTILLIIITFVILYLIFRLCYILTQLNNKIEKHCYTFTQEEVQEFRDQIDYIYTYYKQIGIIN